MCFLYHKAFSFIEQSQYLLCLCGLKNFSQLVPIFTDDCHLFDIRYTIENQYDPKEVKSSSVWRILKSGFFRLHAERPLWP